LAEYAFILRQIIHVSRVKPESARGTPRPISSVGAHSFDDGNTTALFGGPGGSGATSPQRAAVVALGNNGNGGGGAGIAFKLNGGMEMRAAAAAAAAASAVDDEATFTNGQHESKVGGLSPVHVRHKSGGHAGPLDESVVLTPRFRPHPFVSVSEWPAAASMATAACLGAPHGRHHRHQHLVHSPTTTEEDQEEAETASSIFPSGLLQLVGGNFFDTNTNIIELPLSFTLK
jgi:hypothetical protein